MNILICEDEVLYAQMIADYCLEFGYNVVGTVNNSAEFKQLVGKADLVLMDINLGDENGIEVVKKSTNHQFKTIFITAYSDAETVSQAGILQPEDYIIKPFGKEQLRARLTLTSLKIKSNSININSAIGDVSINPEELIYIESYRNYVDLHLTNGEVIKTRKTFKELEELLPTSFIRVHKSFCVNRKYIKAINAKTCLLSNNKEIPFGRKYKEELDL